MLKKLNIYNILFLDLETVPDFADYESLPLPVKNLWDKKSAVIRKENESPAEIYRKAGLYAEFGRIICVSVGIINNKEERNFFRIKSFFNRDEKKLLIEFSEMLSNYSDRKEILLCAHNGKEFDFPFLARRMLINGIDIPDILDTSGKKVWEHKFLDTMDLWRFGNYKHYTSLELLTHLFGIETPKDEMDGSKVADVFWKDNDLNRIVRYCEKDVLSVAQLLLRFKGLELIDPEDIQSV